jgi:hypothetical protein
MVLQRIGHFGVVAAIAVGGVVVGSVAAAAMKPPNLSEASVALEGLDHELIHMCKPGELLDSHGSPDLGDEPGMKTPVAAREAFLDEIRIAADPARNDQLADLRQPDREALTAWMSQYLAPARSISADREGASTDRGTEYVREMDDGSGRVDAYVRVEPHPRGGHFVAEAHFCLSALSVDGAAENQPAFMTGEDA